MTLLQLQAGKLDVMSALGVMLLVVAALGVGYHAGRRGAARTPSWRQRTRRTALGRQALVLALLMAVSQVERSAQRRLPLGRQQPTTHLGRLRRLARR